MHLCLARDQKVAGLNPGRNGRRGCFLFFLRGQISIGRMGASDKLQLDTKAPYVGGFEHSETVNLCIAIWCTHNVHRDGSSFTWHQPTKERCKYTTSVDIQQRDKQPSTPNSTCTGVCVRSCVYDGTIFFSMWVNIHEKTCQECHEFTKMT